jgi:hypothetical protein
VVLVAGVLLNLGSLTTVSVHSFPGDVVVGGNSFGRPGGVCDLSDPPKRIMASTHSCFSDTQSLADVTRILGSREILFRFAKPWREL